MRMQWNLIHLLIYIYQLKLLKVQVPLLSQGNPQVIIDPIFLITHNSTCHVFFSDLMPENQFGHTNPTEERKYIVFESMLIKLFRCCSVCGSPTQLSLSTKGIFLKITRKCDLCDTQSIWESQPTIKNIPAGNLLLLAAILYSGASPTKSLRLFQHMNCEVISIRTFFEHQQQYLHPTVRSMWLRNQSELLANLKREGDPLVVGGDGRADSPGHTAKYGSYTIMDLVNNHILDIQLVQVRKCPKKI